MGSIFAELADALSVTNEVMGVPCSIMRADDHMVTDDVMVILNKNKKVTDRKSVV